MNRRLTQRGRERRQQLMSYATARFAENGYHPTSVAEIVHGLGVGKGVFYWYFASKEELFLEILRDAQRQLRRRQEAAIADEPDPVRRIELGIRASMSWFDEHRDNNKCFEQQLSRSYHPASPLTATSRVSTSTAAVSGFLPTRRGQPSLSAQKPLEAEGDGGLGHVVYRLAALVDVLAG